MTFVPIGGPVQGSAPTPSFTPITTSAPPAPAPSSSGFLSSVLGGIKTLGSDVWGALTQPAAPKSLDLGDAARATTDSVGNAITQAGQSLSDAYTTITSDHANALQKGVAIGQAGMGAVTALFSAATAPLTYASHIPVIGQAADALNNLFGAIGTGGADLAEGAVQALPISDQAKQTITPLAKEVGALVAQIAAGKGGSDALGVVREKTQGILNAVDSGLNVAKTATEGTLPRQLPVEGASTEQPVPFANKYEAPTDIQLGPKAPATDALPVAETSPGPTPSFHPITTIEPSKESTAPVDLPTIQANAPSPRSTIKPVQGTGDLKTRGLSEGIEAKAIEQKLTNTFGDLPEYRAVSMADQARRAADLIASDSEAAKAIALGDKSAPKGLLPESVLVAVERDAIKRGDVQLLRDLATNSRLTYEATTMGQRIRTLGERETTSPVAAIKAVQDAREASLKAKGVDLSKEVQAVVKEARASAVKAMAESRPSWESFIKSITCGY